jgi:hypothetical protein
VEETPVNCLERVVELDADFVELERVLNQVALSEDDDLGVDVVQHDKHRGVLDLGDDDLVEVEQLQSEVGVGDRLHLNIKSVESVDVQLLLVQRSVKDEALILLELASGHLSVVDVLLFSLERMGPSDNVDGSELVGNLASDLRLLTDFLESLLRMAEFAAGLEAELELKNVELVEWNEVEDQFAVLSGVLWKNVTVALVLVHI